ncbi:hypothetical protein FORC30_0045 [Salmonella enterica]|nr:hypothetical protein FORC30_0045 [Salmonella enterica]
MITHFTMPENKKTSPKRGSYSVMRVVAAKHTVLCQQQKYTRSVQNAQFRREF